MSRGPAVLLGLAAILAASPLSFAHDFWIEPSSWRPAAGATVDVRLLVGTEFRGDPFARSARHAERFVLSGGFGERPVPGVEGEDPAGKIVVDSPGLQVLAYRSRRSRIELEAAKFEEYLKEEGLEAIRRLRAERGQTEKAAREVYSRNAKALLRVGEGGEATGFDREVGLVLELVPETDPHGAGSAGDFSVRLLYRGKPLADSLVVAYHRTDPKVRSAGRTDADGRVRLKLSRPGPWLVKGIHMIEAPPDADADFESFWASLTFDVPAPTPSADGAAR